MPIYEYECLECGQRTERLQRMDEGPLPACPACGGPVKKLFSAPSFQFKGSGWYATDYGGRGKEPGAEKGGGEGKESKEAKEGKEGAAKEGKQEGKETKKEEKPAAAAKSESKGSEKS